MSNVTLAEFRAWARLDVAVSDGVAQAAIDAAEESINDHLGRQVELAGDTATERTFVPDGDSPVLRIHDCTEITLVEDNGVVVPSDAWQAEPVNGIDSTGQEVPYSQIRLLAGSWTALYNNQATVTITARWGWASLPSRYKQAVMIAAADLLQQADVRNGVIGYAGDYAVRVKSNPAVTQLLRKLRRAESWGVGR